MDYEEIRREAECIADEVLSMLYDNDGSGCYTNRSCNNGGPYEAATAVFIEDENRNVEMIIVH